MAKQDKTLSEILNEPTQGVAPLQVEIVRDRRSLLRLILKVIATLAVIWIIIRVVFMLIAYRVVTDGSSQTSEKIIIQNYYQETGIRAASKAEVIEANLLAAEEQRKNSAQQTKERALQEQERKYKQFIDESERTGSQVSAELTRAAEQERYEAERKKQQLEDDERRRLEAENARAEEAINKWKKHP